MVPQHHSYERFRLFPFRSPLLWESRLISFPPGTEMFHFPGYRFIHLCIQCMIISYEANWVSPFGNRRVKEYLPLTDAYRSLSRPSSPSDAKAFTACP